MSSSIDLTNAGNYAGLMHFINANLALTEENRKLRESVEKANGRAAELTGLYRSLLERGPEKSPVVMSFNQEQLDLFKPSVRLVHDFSFRGDCIGDRMRPYDGCNLSVPSLFRRTVPYTPAEVLIILDVMPSLNYNAAPSQMVTNFVAKGATLTSPYIHQEAMIKLPEKFIGIQATKRQVNYPHEHYLVYGYICHKQVIDNIIQIDKYVLCSATDIKFINQILYSNPIILLPKYMEKLLPALYHSPNRDRMFKRLGNAWVLDLYEHFADRVDEYWPTIQRGQHRVSKLFELIERL